MIPDSQTSFFIYCIFSISFFPARPCHVLTVCEPLSLVSITWQSLGWTLCTAEKESSWRLHNWQKMTATSPRAINSQESLREGCALMTPLLFMMKVDWSSHIQVYADNHSCSEFMCAMTVSCPEDFILLHFSPFSGSYSLSAHPSVMFSVTRSGW